jgi:hypothetical protein
LASLFPWADGAYRDLRAGKPQRIPLVEARGALPDTCDDLNNLIDHNVG